MVQARCLVLQPGDYHLNNGNVVAHDVRAVYDAEIVLVVDSKGDTTVIKNKWGARGRIVP